MASVVTRLVSLTTIFYAFMMQSHIILIKGQQVPCFFIFGDSQFDNGNNNVLVTSAKVNYSPYGIDYLGGQATGRFANGAVVPDYLAQSLGFDRPISPFVTVRGSDTLRGVNYASGLAGILDETGYLGGGRFTFNAQLLNHATIISRITLLRNDLNTTNDYLKRCLYVVNIGSNDYLNNYLQPPFYPRSNLSPQQFADLLIRNLSKQLKTLYNYGARRIAVFSVGLLGCVPQELARNPTNGASCVASINNDAQLFNDRLVPLINNLNGNLSGAHFTIINVTSISLLGPQPGTIRFTNVSCCTTVSVTGLCAPGSTPCSNRNEYAFWDNFHTTSVVNQATAARAYSAAVSTDAYPVDISRLIMG